MEKLKLPTIFHITHWKAGSQWVAEILKQSAPERFIPWGVNKAGANHGRGEASFRTTPLIPGSIYGTVYLPRSNFEAKVYGFPGDSLRETVKFPRPALSNLWNYRIKRNPCKIFVVIRDIRDTLVSFYFSTKYSHPQEVNAMITRRSMLKELNEEAGLIYMLDEALPEVAKIQSSWVKASEALMFRYEDIINDQILFFESLVEYCEIKVEPEALRNMIKFNTFRYVSGRERGDEDPKSHYRKGISGDWKNHFSDHVKTEFKQRFGQLLIDTGYEKDLDW